MNRLSSAVVPRMWSSDSSRRSLTTAGRFHSADHDTQHAIWTPLHYEPNYAYPLLIWLHGPGDDENQLKRIMMQIDARNYAAVAPRGTCRTEGASPAKYDWLRDEGHLSLAEERVARCLDDVQSRFRVHPKRIFLAGYDSGGTMAYRLALAARQPIAGVLSFGGAFPRVRAPLGRLHDARRIPVFMATALESSLYTPEQACADLRLLHSAGVSITLRQYPGGHALTSSMLTDMNRWLMEQICGPESGDEETEAI